MRVGIDTGGTFTDVILVDGRICLTHKRLSTPSNPGEAVLAGLQAVVSQRLLQGLPTNGDIVASPPCGGADVVHGSTVATNALLEGTGGRAALLTTAGFEDVLWLGRQARPSLYALHPAKNAIPLERSAVCGVRERTYADGSIGMALSDEAIRGVISWLSKRDCEAIAICFLHSYANAAHEAQMVEACREAFPSVHVTASHELVREFREYERASTMLVNAVAAPPICRYIGGLRDAIGADKLRIMGSAGGAMPPSTIEAFPAHTVVSGPAGGVVAALHFAKEAGISNIITLDMGGTSTDVSLCAGDLLHTMEGGIAGLPVRLPMIDIETVGAGGGSLAWLDAGGALQVGPRSLGASPGPACYGLQPAPYQPAVTDAHVVVGHLFDGQLLASTLPIQAERARAAIGGLAEAAGLSLEAMAEGILQVAESVMARAMQRISMQKGFDPRDFVLLPFGGAGGLHACRLASRMGMTQVLLPPHAGLLSAAGMLIAQPRYEVSQGVLCELIADVFVEEPTIALLKDALDGLHERLVAQIQRESAFQRSALTVEDGWTWQVNFDMRYVGQSYELPIPISSIREFTAATIDDSRTSFAQEHERLYGYTAPERAIQIVAVRLVAQHAQEAPVFSTASVDGVVLPDTHTMFADGHWLSARCLWREALVSGDAGEGPLILCESSGTTVVPAQWSFVVLPCGSMLLTEQS